MDETNSTDLTGYISDLGSLGTTASNLLGAVQGKKPAAAAAAPAASSSFTKYLPWIIGGVVGLLVLFMVIRK
jgi:hypothetical protein